MQVYIKGRVRTALAIHKITGALIGGGVPPLKTHCLGLLLPMLRLVTFFTKQPMLSVDVSLQSTIAPVWWQGLVGLITLIKKQYSSVVIHMPPRYLFNAIRIWRKTNVIFDFLDLGGRSYRTNLFQSCLLFQKYILQRFLI